jgi:hypothetical protein
VSARAGVTALCAALLAVAVLLPLATVIDAALPPSEPPAAADRGGIARLAESGIAAAAPLREPAPAPVASDAACLMHAWLAATGRGDAAARLLFLDVRERELIARSTR